MTGVPRAEPGVREWRDGGREQRGDAVAGEGAAAALDQQPEPRADDGGAVGLRQVDGVAGAAAGARPLRAQARRPQWRQGGRER